MNLLIAFFLVSAMIAVSLAAPKSHLSSPKPKHEIIRDDALKHRFGNQILFAHLNANTRYDFEQLLLQAARCAFDYIDILSQQYDFVELWKPYKQDVTHHLNIMENCPDKRCFEREFVYIDNVLNILLLNLQAINPHTSSVVFEEATKACIPQLNY